MVEQLQSVSRGEPAILGIDGADGRRRQHRTGRIVFQHSGHAHGVASASAGEQFAGRFRPILRTILRRKRFQGERSELRLQRVGFFSSVGFYPTSVRRRTENRLRSSESGDPADVERCVKHIVNGGAHIPRIESHLFDSKTKLLVRHVRSDEEIVNNTTQRVLQVFLKNLPGPQLYLHEYDQYQNLLNNKAESEVNEFLRHAHALTEFETEIKERNALINEIIVRRITAPLNLISLDCRDLNDHLIRNVQKLRDKLVQYCIEDNSRLNKEIVREYDEIATTVSVPADEIEELVRTADFLTKAMESSIYKLAYKIGEAKERLMFLLDYAIMSRKFEIATEKYQEEIRFSRRFEIERPSFPLAGKHYEHSGVETKGDWPRFGRKNIRLLCEGRCYRLQRTCRKNVCTTTSLDTRRNWKICRRTSISSDEKM